jgi:hypothetical protein
MSEHNILRIFTFASSKSKLEPQTPEPCYLMMVVIAIAKQKFNISVISFILFLRVNYTLFFSNSKAFQ